MSYLNKIKEEIQKELEVGEWEFVEIRIRLEAHEELKKELQQKSNLPFKQLESILGMRVIIDDSIPKNKAFLLRKKRPSEKQNE